VNATTELLTPAIRLAVGARDERMKAATTSGQLLLILSTGLTSVLGS